MRGLWQVVLLSAGVLAGSNAVAQAPEYPMRPPVYPPALLAKNIGGQVILRVQLDAQGRPREVQIERSSGHPELDQSAVTAAQGWTFRADAGRLLRLPVNFDPRLDSGAGVPAPLDAELLSMLIHWQNSRVPLRATDADGRLPWNVPDPLPLPDGPLAGMLEQVRRQGTRLPDAALLMEEYETRSEQGSFRWSYFPQSHWRFGPAIIRQRLVNDGEKSYWAMAARSEASSRGQAALHTYTEGLGRQQPGIPPPPPPPYLLERLQQHQRAGGQPDRLP